VENNKMIKPKLSFRIEDDKIIKRTEIGNLNGECSHVFQGTNEREIEQADLAKTWAVTNLKSKRRPIYESNGKKPLRLADFFCGCGGLSLGVTNSLNAVGIDVHYSIACDISKDSLDVYNANFSPDCLIHENAANLVRRKGLGTTSGIIENNLDQIELSPEICDHEGKIDVFVAGPPCEGNSNLNNKTRRIDARNNHYVTAVMIAVKLRAEIIIVENVQTVTKAKQNVVEHSKVILQQAGYSIENIEYTLKAEKFNVAQKRVRHFVIAVKNKPYSNSIDFNGLVGSQINTIDVIKDLVGRPPTNIMDLFSVLSAENKRRIDFLFKNDLYDLPDSERPFCHREKEHTYPSVYGRLFPNQPAFTITTGFQSPGRGRYIHPTVPRGLTPREGARLQSFPDYFKWRTPLCRTTKNSITRLIGDAVPPNLGETAMSIALASCKNLQ
jgi:DNA (cytosine-5)-methyltransferase 1